MIQLWLFYIECLLFAVVAFLGLKFGKYQTALEGWGLIVLLIVSLTGTIHFARHILLQLNVG